MTFIATMTADSIFEKLPCGGDWWKISYPEGERWGQHVYGASETKSVQQKVCVEAPAVKSTEVQARSARIQCVSLLDKVLCAIDPYAELYTKSQYMDALCYLKERLFRFVTGEAHVTLGPKRSRTLSMWLSGNPCKQDHLDIVRQFVDHLTEGRAQEWDITVDRFGRCVVKK